MKLLGAKGGAVGAVIVTAVCIIVFCLIMRGLQDTYPAYTNSEVDFEDNEIVYHTADQGIAVVPVAHKIRQENPPVKTPDEIWEKDVTHTFNNFTLPQAVQMDDESIGVLTINDIGLSVRVYDSGDQMEDMTRGVAHFKSTSAWMGNVALSAHNVNMDGTDGYFLNLHKLKPGVVIRYETALGVREYKVDSIREIVETDWSGLGRTQHNQLSLITCITGKPTMRLMVTAIENV